MSSAAESEYLAAVDAHLEALHRGGIRNFGSLLGAGRGADPILVAERARATGLDITWDVPRWTPDHHRPELHALRSEWYFTAPVAAQVAARFGHGRLLCLGAPTVAAAAPGSVLVDRSPSTVAARFGERVGSVLACDLGRATDLPSVGTVDAVVLDPPWYAPHPQRWLALAARAVTDGGVVAMVIPPELQRPAAGSQRAAIIAMAETIGPTTVEPGAVRYATPLFEVLALAAAGLEVPPAWRTADLLVVRVERPPLRPDAPPQPEPEVEVFVIDGQVVTLGPTKREGPAALQPVPDTRNFVWDRITTRDPRIEAIDIWTSRSRVATVTGRAAVRRVLLALADGASIAQACPGRSLGRAMASLLDRSG